MKSTVTKPSKKSDDASRAQDEIYLKIWEIEQHHTVVRWTITTFFLGVSFAVFGFSFQAGIVHPLPNVIRFSGLIIYWFSYLLFLRFNSYTNLLRNYLLDLETSKSTNIRLQSLAQSAMRKNGKRRLSATRLLFYFGFLYLLGTVILWGY